MRASQVENVEDVRRPHRSYIEMRAAILRAMKVESSPTRIMCRANLSWKMLNTLLPGMAAKGLVNEASVNARKSYSLTQRGLRALGLFEFVRKELSEPTDPKAWTVDDETTQRASYSVDLFESLVSQLPSGRDSMGLRKALRNLE